MVVWQTTSKNAKVRAACAARLFFFTETSRLFSVVVAGVAYVTENDGNFESFEILDLVYLEIVDIKFRRVLNLRNN